MTEEILTIAVSLLAVYGLSCIVMKIVVRLTSSYRGEKAFVIIPITDMSQITDRIMWGKLRFDPTFQKNQVEFVVVDCGLERAQSSVLKRYCDGEGIAFCKDDCLMDFMHDSICKEFLEGV